MVEFCHLKKILSKVFDRTKLHKEKDLEICIICFYESYRDFEVNFLVQTNIDMKSVYN